MGSETKSVAELLAASLPVARFYDVAVLRGPLERDASALFDAVAAEVDDYLCRFIRPSDDCRCVACGSPLLGLLGRFTWGIANGEGSCGACHYPTRMIHRLTTAGGPLTFRHPLQYHPNEFETESLEREG